MTTPSVFQRLKLLRIPTILRRSNKRPINLPLTPLYELNPLPWWTRWTYLLVTADAIFTVSACELTWSHWTTTAAKSSSPTTDSAETTYTLRPWYHRLGAVAFQAGIGSYIALMIIVGRTRIIRKLWVLPSGSMETISSDTAKAGGIGCKHVFFQCIHHWDSRGQIFPYRSFKLQESPRSEEVLLKIDGVRGLYSMSLDGARINGQGTTEGRDRGRHMEWVKQELWDAWRAEGGARRRNRPKFTSGPVVSAP